MAIRPRAQIDDWDIQFALRRLDLATGGRMAPAMHEIGRYLKTSVQLRFREQRAPDGTPWKPSRRAREEGGQTLRMTSRLRNSFDYQADEQSVAVGTNVVYAPAMHFGYRGRQQVPPHLRRITQAFGQRLRFPVYVNVRAHTRSQVIDARPIVGLSDADRSEVLDILREHIERLAGG